MKLYVMNKVLTALRNAFFPSVRVRLTPVLTPSLGPDSRTFSIHLLKRPFIRRGKLPTPPPPQPPDPFSVARLVSLQFLTSCSCKACCVVQKFLSLLNSGALQSLQRPGV